MSIPSYLLPPLGPEESEENRKNLSLHSKHGSVTAEIWLLGVRDAQPFDSKKTKRTTLDICSQNGSVTARVVCCLFDCPGSPLIRLLAHYPRGCAVLAHHFCDEWRCECHSSALFPWSPSSNDQARVRLTHRYSLQQLHASESGEIDSQIFCW
jgi:hypothetical protein